MNTLQDVCVFVFTADDHELDRLQTAFTERRKLLRATQAHEALVTFKVGDHVELQGLSPKYLNGATGKILRVEGTRFAVTLDRPVGRFNGVVRVPTSAVRARVTTGTERESG